MCNGKLVRRCINWGEIEEILTIHEQMALVRLFDRPGGKEYLYIMDTETVDSGLVERDISHGLWLWIVTSCNCSCEPTLAIYAYLYM